jgi:hypothetical protein
VDSFVFALNATMPVFLMILLGYFLRRIHLLNEAFCSVADKYVFKVALPMLLFLDIAESDLRQDFNLTFVLFCMIGTTVMFLGVWALTRIFLKDKSLVGAFSQAAVRGSAAILGIAFVENIYGNAGMTPLMIVAAVPLFNIFSVIILSFSAEQEAGGSAIRTACRNVITNPIIIGIVLGLPFALLQITIPAVPHKVLSSIGGTATPIALLSIGATFEGRKALKKLKPTAVASAIKLMILPALYLPVAVALGLRGSELIAVLIMVGSPTTVSCYIMAKNMRNDGQLTASIVVATTLLSSVTLTFWIFLLRVLSLI